MYDLTLNVHESLLASRYLWYKGEYLTTSLITESTYLTAFSFESELLKRSILFITDSFILGINIRLDSVVKMRISENLNMDFNLKIYPGDDPITGKPKPILSPISQKCALAKFQVKPSGMNVDAVQPKASVIIAFSGLEKFRIGLS